MNIRATPSHVDFRDEALKNAQDEAQYQQEQSKAAFFIAVQFDNLMQHMIDEMHPGAKLTFMDDLQRGRSPLMLREMEEQIEKMWKKSQ